MNRHLITAVLIAVAYYCGVWLALAVRLPGSNFSPIWPPVAILLAALLLTPSRLWWIWLLVAIPAHLAIYLPLGVPLWRQAIQLLHNLFMVLIPAIVLRRYAPEAVQLVTFRGVLIFLSTVVATAAIVPLFSAAVYLAVGVTSSIWLMWQLIALSNVLPYLTILPAILIVAQEGLSWWRQVTVPRLVEAAILAASVLAVGEIVFGVLPPGALSGTILRTATLPLLLWAAIRFGVGGASFAVTTMTLAALWNAAYGAGPFTAEAPTQNVLNLPSYFLTFAAPMLLLAALMADRRRSEETLVQLTSQLEDRVTARTAELAHTNAQLAIARDQAEAANRAKSDFLATMSHELRTPLHTIMGYNRLLLSSPTLPPEDNERALVVQRGAEHLLTLINNVLDLSKIEAGQTPLQITTVNLTRLLDGLSEMFRLQAERKRLRLRCLVEPDIPRYIAVDTVKLRQVLINLLANAVKFTQAGGITLTVRRAAPERQPQSVDGTAGPPTVMLNFEVADTGPGITPDEQQQMFKAFVQTNAGQRMGEGTGLGLTISQQFVNLMGGRLRVRSSLGHGTVFEVVIPAQIVRVGAMPAEEAPGRALTLAAGQPAYRILVVDDHEDNRLLLIAMLTSLGLTVRGARDGEEALAIWWVWQPQFIFLDLRLPRRNGFDVARHIRETVHERPPTIVALSASGFDTDREAALAAGCNEFIRKPFQDTEIINSMRHHLGMRFTEVRTEARPLAPTSPRAGLDPVALAALPADLLAILEQVSVEGYPQQIAATIAQIRLYTPALAAAMQALADQVAFDVILEAVRAAQTVRGSHDPK